MAKFSNKLSKESSPYLQQHAHNPVQWHPWGKKAFEMAQEDNKLLIISIGYSSCHWCHVMEKESFEDELTAKNMNDHFISVKVDREEHPNVDQQYMGAVQLMTGQGGWPLNVVALPDGRPIWGGTYFKKESWNSSLLSIVKLWKEEPDKVIEYAENLERGIQQLELVERKEIPKQFEDGFLVDMINAWSKSFDWTHGGMNRAPKFPMPHNYLFLLRMSHLSENQKLKEFTELSLNNMAFGGIYDQVGGGFARYSTDIKWKVPHFEKMLYDNAQLVSLYAEAYGATKNEVYSNIVAETLKFLEREMQSPEGLFYSALDADSEGVEGKFYVWNEEELKQIIPKDELELFFAFYKIEDSEKWEGNFILQQAEAARSFAQKHDLDISEFITKKAHWKKLLLTEREKRVRPGLDDKSLCAWNGLMVKAYADAYRFLGKKKYRKKARNLLERIELHFTRPSGGLWHTFKEGEAKIEGLLDDYAFLIQAKIAVYEINFNAYLLQSAKNDCLNCLDQFTDDQSLMLFYSPANSHHLISRGIEKEDNVIPSSNAIMALNLFKLSHHFSNEFFKKRSIQMLSNMKEEMMRYPSGYTQWAILYAHYSLPFYELAFTGKDARTKLIEFENRSYHPNKLITGCLKDSDLDLLKNRYMEGKNMIYVCQNQQCQLPTEDIDHAVSLMA